MEVRTKYQMKTRTLADGTKKTYRSIYHYKVKNGVNDRRHDGNAGRKEKLTPAQKEEVWAKYCADVKIKRICADMSVSHITVKKCIDKKKAELAKINPPVPPAPPVPTNPTPVPTNPTPVPPNPTPVQPILAPPNPPPVQPVLPKVEKKPRGRPRKQQLVNQQVEDNKPQPL